MSIMFYSVFLGVLANSFAAATIDHAGDVFMIPKKAGQRQRSLGSDAQKWPKGVVPFAIDPAMSQLRKDNIKLAMEQFKIHTCIRFVPWSNQKNYVNFTSGEGCSSYVGIVDIKGQPVDTAVGCRTSDIMHEVMHALGFQHENQRWDRDEHVKIHFENVPAEFHESIFGKIPNDPIIGALPYDYISLMHYTSTAFNSGGDKITIEPLDKKSYKDVEKRMGMEAGFSTCDILKINTAYKCPGFEKLSPGLCTRGKVERRPVKSCPKDSQSFCKGLDTYFCHEQPGKYLINCRQTCENCEGTCYDSLDGDKRKICDKIPKNGSKSCTKEQTLLCPATCGLC